MRPEPSDAGTWGVRGGWMRAGGSRSPPAGRSPLKVRRGAMEGHQPLLALVTNPACIYTLLYAQYVLAGGAIFFIQKRAFLVKKRRLEI